MFPHLVVKACLQKGCVIAVLNKRANIMHVKAFLGTDIKKNVKIICI